MEHNGQYAVKIINEAGEAISVANVVVEKESTPPPRPPEPVTDSGTETRDHSPASRSTTSCKELGPESQALKTLASFKRHSKPLPDLLPFPFEPDEMIHRPKRNKSKVPKPSKFIKGEMYHSDYESDFEGNIGVKWRAYQSDTEEWDIHYRKVKPVLSKGFSNTNLERRPSPPCPHKWESHEDIDKLESELKRPKTNVKIIKEYERKEEVICHEETNISQVKSAISTPTSINVKIEVDTPEEKVDENEKMFYEATSIVKSYSNTSINGGCLMQEAEAPPPLPAKLKVNVLTPSPSMKSVDSGSFSDETNITMSSMSTVQTARNSSQYIRVREKVSHFERKLEEDYLKQALEAESEDKSSIRPENIPGAIRVLPTPTPPGSRPGSRPDSRASSRKNSLGRSNSSDAIVGALNLVNPQPRSIQPSPIFGRKYQEHPPPMFVPPNLESIKNNSIRKNVPLSNYLDTEKSEEPLPPSKFETPLVFDGKPRPDIDLNKTVEEIKKLRSMEASSSLSEDIVTLGTGISRSETSTSFVFKTDTQIQMTSPPPLERVCHEDSNQADKDEDSRFMSHFRYPSHRRSRSRSVLSEDEEHVRLNSPKLVLMANNAIKRGSIDGYEADTDTLKSKKGSVRNIASIFEKREMTNPSPVPRPASAHQFQSLKNSDAGFTMSTAYVPPTWSDNQNENVIKSFNETKIIRINHLSITNTSTMKTHNSEISNFESKFNLGMNSNTKTKICKSPYNLL